MNEQYNELIELIPSSPKIGDTSSPDMFIFLGKTQVGKTTVINILCNSENEIGGKYNSSTTQVKKSIGYNEDNKPFACIDTPGTSDLEKTNKEINKQIYDFLIMN